MVDLIRRDRSRINKLISTLNVMILLFGYEFCTVICSAVIGDVGNTQIVTIPFRAISLCISIIAFLFNVKEKLFLNNPGKAFLILWGLIICRFIYDYYVSYGEVDPRVLNKYWLFMICLTIVPLLSIFKSWRSIDFNKLLLYSFLLIGIAVVVSFFSNTAFQTASEERIDANAALNTISSGHMGLSGIILSIFVVKKPYKVGLYQYLALPVFVISCLILLRSGSRGPLLSSLGIIVYCLIFGTKNTVRSLFTIVGLYCVWLIFSDDIVQIINDISPILKQRMFDRTDQLSDRSVFYEYAWNSFCESPIWGAHFAVKTSVKNIMYPHNIFLEVLMQLGIIGLTIYSYTLISALKSVNCTLRRRTPGRWVSILFLQMFFMLIVSGSMTLEPKYSILMGLVLIQEYCNVDVVEYRVVGIRREVISQNKK